MVDNVSIIIFIRACFSFDFPISTSKISELASSKGPEFRKEELLVLITNKFNVKKKVYLETNKLFSI